MAGQKKKKQPRELRLLKNVLKPKAEEVKKSLCSFSYFVTVVKTLCLIVFYYFFSISLTFYNQHFIHVSHIYIYNNNNKNNRIYSAPDPNGQNQFKARAKKGEGGGAEPAEGRRRG